MEYVEKKALRESGRVLRGCEDFMKNRMPPSGIRVVKKRGLMHTVFNNLAQHANLMADMPRSIDYLKMALEVADDKETDKRLLPLAETFLNLANGTSYLNRYHEALEYAEKAMKFADKKCNKLRAEIIAFQRKPEFEQNQDIFAGLQYQLNDFLNIKVMSFICLGEQREKMGQYTQAMKCYNEGKMVAETNFGPRHDLYTRCVNLMGGARLKSKYQTREVYRQPKKGSPTQSSKDKLKKKENREKQR